MKPRYRRLSAVLFSAFWLVWLIAKRLLSGTAEMVRIFGLVAILLVAIIVFGVRQTRRDAQSSTDDPKRG